MLSRLSEDVVLWLIFPGMAAERFAQTLLKHGETTAGKYTLARFIAQHLRFRNLFGV